MAIRGCGSYRPTQAIPLQGCALKAYGLGIRLLFPVAFDSLSLSARGSSMNVLLLSMPDYFEHMAPVAIRMPNGALTSLAGNVDDHHRVAVADLILRHRQVRETVQKLIH